MATVSLNYICDLNQAVRVQYVDGNVFSGDNGGNTINVYVMEGGQPATIGGEVTASVIRADGATVPVSGSLSGNRAYVTLPQACYAIPGPISIVIKLTLNEVVTTICALVANVYRSSTDTVVDPGQIIPDINALIEAINEAVASIPADYSNLYWSLLETGRDVLPLGGVPASQSAAGGVAVTQIDKSTFRFLGTIASSNFVSWYQSVSLFPNFLKKGGRYTVSISGASSGNVNGIYFEVLGFRNGSTAVSFTGYLYSDGLYNFTIPSDFTGGVYIRAGWLGANSGHVVDETIEYHIYSRFDEGIMQYSNILHYCSQYDVSYSSCDDVPPGVIQFVSSEGGVLTIPDFPFNAPGTLACFGIDNFPVQMAVNWNQENPSILIRSKLLGGTWSGWSQTNQNALNMLGWANEQGITDLNDISKSCVIFVSTIGGISGIDNYPFAVPGMVQTFIGSNSIRWQLAYPYLIDTYKVKMRVDQNGTWTSWKDISGGSSTVTIEQEVSRDTYNNTYNIEVSPQITTDANGWLQPVDTNTADETGKTDMTGAIMAMLNQTGYCHLAPGIYYVSGNIDMPANSLIEGCGKQTIIRLLQSVESGYIIRVHTRSTIKNICFSGGYNPGSISNSNIGGRRGINYIGNRDGQTIGITPTTCTLCQVEGCWFENLDSGFYGYNAGGGLQEGIEMSNCYFTRCKAGINIDYWTEYCKFVNCVMFQCYYACINNGGNNVFMNCTFHGVIGFLIDNSSGNKQNCAHGSVIGCTFNHIDNMNNPDQLGKGFGIKVYGAVAGFIFANCQLWYGRVYVENSTGVQITGCEFGGIGGASYPVIQTEGSGIVFVDNCLFQTIPVFDFSSPVKMLNCWTYSGAAVNP